MDKQEKNQDPKIFVTGATGFVGSNLVKMILEQGELGIKEPKEVACLVRSPDKAVNKLPREMTLVPGSLKNKELLHEVTKNISQAIIHIAALYNYYSKKKEYEEINVEGTRNILNAFVNSESNLFIYVSTIGVYDQFGKREATYTEEAAIDSKKGPHYNLSKRKAEQLVRECAIENPEKKFIILRPGGITGPGDENNVALFINSFNLKMMPKMIRGENTLPYVDVRDLCKAIIHSANNAELMNGKAYNVCNESVEYKEMFEIVAEKINKKAPKIAVPYWFVQSSFPIIKLWRMFFKGNKNSVIQVALLGLSGRKIFCPSDKLVETGFVFDHPIRKSMEEGIDSYLNQK
jgi:dihydroflavonol-4-reductase